MFGCGRTSFDSVKKHAGHDQEQCDGCGSENDGGDQDQNAETALVLGLGSGDPDENREAAAELI
jgi:hypothetical protein